MRFNPTSFENIERSQGQAIAMQVARRWVAVANGMEFGLETISAFYSWEETEPPSACYVNVGETYEETIVRMPDGTYELTTWGDALESLESDRCEDRDESRCYACGEWYANSDGPCHPGDDGDDGADTRRL